MAGLARHMGVFFASLLAATLLLVFSAVARGEPVGAAVDRSPAGAPYAAGELVVTYKEAASDRAVETLDEEAGAEVEQVLLPGVPGGIAPHLGEREETRIQLRQILLHLRSSLLIKRLDGPIGGRLLVGDDQLSCGVGRAGRAPVHGGADRLAPGYRREHEQECGREQGREENPHVSCETRHAPSRCCAPSPC